MAAHPGNIHRAAEDGDLRVLKATLDAYPGAARDRDRDGLLPLHLAAKYGRAAAAKMLLDVYPEAARDGQHAYPEAGANVHQMFQPDVPPELQVMIALSQVGHTPSRPWTTATPRALRDAAERYEIVAPILLAHLSRVRDVVLVVRRCGLPAHLAPVIAGALYALELW